MSAPIRDPEPAVPPATDEADQRLAERSPWSLALERFMHQPAGVIGTTILLLMVICVVLAPVISPHSPLATNRGFELQPPSSEFIFGTDQLGRDLLSRIIYGSRISFLVSIIAVAIGSVMGCSTGMASGLSDGWLSRVTMRTWDVIFALPAILIGIALAAAFGPSPLVVGIAVGIASAPIFARVGRGAVVEEAGKDYVQSARAIGMSDARILRTHILHNALAPVLVQVPIAMSLAIVVEATLSFLGLGAQPPTPSWGVELSAAQDYLRTAWWYSVFPGAVITALAIGLTLISDALRDALDPRSF